VIEAIYQTNAADLYLYLCNDAMHAQDGTRMHEAERNALDRSHRAVLKQHGISFIEIQGDWEARFERAKMTIDEMLIQKDFY